MSKDFNSRFGISDDNLEELKNQFVNRVNSHLFSWLESDDGFYWHSDFVLWISLKSGKAWNEKFHQNHEGQYVDMSLKIVAGNDFIKTLLLVEYCHEFIDTGRLREMDRRYIFDNSRVVNTRNFNRRIEDVFLNSSSEIGIFWKDGNFYRAGAKELDDALILDNLLWLDKYPAIKIQYNVALNHFKDSLGNLASRKDAITNAYSSIEGLTRLILKNNKTFEKNSNDLVDEIGLSKEYKQIIYNYKQIAHEYSSRHSGSNFSNKEAEAFMYLTGLLMRLILSKE
ncbi:hypothetical protein L6270_05075 [Candidatus Parcubacteria bacterium]|nr:hypothetical protein [Patescibacteria group bacterium]MBU4309334.1 hypothetical protein [Patescibacteria group bacterium]MBU4432311.1 hypothetical protein [Patescibacteria group bacterium]MBU4577695.1 hypothetical protein [Patescibacteria group bacterium]MCG2697381.1 hypothetical protein [Candidatus Parcubacteria bacterium]